MISRIDLGARGQSFVPLDDTYILHLPQHRDSDAHSESHLTVFRLSPSSPSHPLCAFQLPSVTLGPGEIITGRSMCTSRHPPVPEGHFHDDPSMSTVVLTHHIDTESPTHPTRSRVSHLLIPCAALRAQIRVIFDSDSKPDPLAPPRLVPWRDWGPHASLRLMLPVHPHPNHISKYVSLVPYGSRMPVVTFDDAGCTRASVYVFDINPLVARHSKHILTQVQSGSGNMTTTTAIVEDVEAALPGVVDPENSAIPFVMYRFGIPLPAMVGSTWRVIEAVRMSMTGFTVTVSSSRHVLNDIVQFGLGLRETDHTWTV